MIHFDFTVSDEDAENIFGCINLEITHCHVEIMENMVKKNEDGIRWYKKRIEYLKELKLKMLNDRK
jgi:hypothetical protein